MKKVSFGEFFRWLIDYGSNEAVQSELYDVNSEYNQRKMRLFERIMMILRNSKKIQ